MGKDKALKDQIKALGRKLRNLRLAVAKGGNLSVRINKNIVLITVTSSVLGELKDKDIVRIDLSTKLDRKKQKGPS